MPYKVEIAKTESNNSFLKNLPEDLLPKLAGQLKRLGIHPHLGRSVEAPIHAYTYSFNISHAGHIQKFVVSYKIDESRGTVFITGFGREIIQKR